MPEGWPILSLDTILDWMERKVYRLRKDEDIQDYVGEWINNWIVTPFQEC